MAIVWAAGTLMLLAAEAFARLQLVWLRRRLLPADGETRQRLTRLARNFALTRPARLLADTQASTPFAFGLRHPTIVIPITFTSEFSPEQQDAVLAHELAHVAARDAAWQLWTGVMVAFLWWCPLAWVTRWRLRVAMELAADEASLVLPDGARNLADCLVSLGRSLASRSRSGALGMVDRATRSGLARRVQRLLVLSDRHRRPIRRGRMSVRFSVVTVFLFCSLLPSVLVRADHSFQNGESTMRFFTQSWPSFTCRGARNHHDDAG